MTYWFSIVWQLAPAQALKVFNVPCNADFWDVVRDECLFIIWYFAGPKSGK